MTNTPREWEGEFEERFGAKFTANSKEDEAKVQLLQAYHDKVFLGEIKSFIRTIEDKARAEERERVRKLVEGLDESEGVCGRATEEACAAFSRMCRHDGYSKALSDIISALNERV